MPTTAALTLPSARQDFANKVEGCSIRAPEEYVNAYGCGNSARRRANASPGNANRYIGTYYRCAGNQQGGGHRFVVDVNTREAGYRHCPGLTVQKSITVEPY